MPEIQPHHDLVEEMKNFVPLQEDQEAIDEARRLNEGGGGVEVGSKLVKSKEKNRFGYSQETYKKVPGEVKKKTPEAVSREMTPLEKMIDDEENPASQIDEQEVQVAQQQIESERKARRLAENAAGWSPKVEKASEEKEVLEVVSPVAEGMGKGASNGKARRKDIRNWEKGISAEDLGRTHADLQYVEAAAAEDKGAKVAKSIYEASLDKDGRPPEFKEGKTLLERIKKMFGR